MLISVFQMHENMYHTYVNMPYTPINMQKKNKFKRGTEGLTGLSAPLKTPQSEGLQGVPMHTGQLTQQSERLPGVWLHTGQQMS